MKVNQYEQRCADCGEMVPAGEGKLERVEEYGDSYTDATGTNPTSWTVTHYPKCPEKEQVEEQEEKEIILGDVIYKADKYNGDLGHIEKFATRDEAEQYGGEITEIVVADEVARIGRMRGKGEDDAKKFLKYKLKNARSALK